MMQLFIISALGAGLYLAVKSVEPSAVARSWDSDTPGAHAPGETDQGRIMQYFEPSEFGPWWPDMSRELLQKLDKFRGLWGAPVEVSPAAGGIGRHLGPGDTSQHNIDRWGKVLAVDLFPKVPAGRSGYRYMSTRADRARALRCAKQAGFSGIGLYTDTRPGNMVHLDVRQTEAVALWSRINGNYLGINEAIA
jgi:hypothetical protein